MSDLISRQAAIEALAKFVPYAICDESTESYTNGLTDAYNLICQLPSAQPEQQWIPVTERLPEKECFALVTVNDGAIYTDLSLFRKDGRFIEHTGDVIAWMPLPEPYREETE